uniref:Uncharacterized protein n=1 Tax=Arundo donax TaxID=35708 RepID=A0A0A8XWY4_ARUDO
MILSPYNMMLYKLTTPLSIIGMSLQPKFYELFFLRSQIL